MVPCVRDETRAMLNEELTPLQSPVIQSLELGKLLAETGKITFRADGTCMYPTVRPGDILHVEPKNIQEIKVGDIAVFRRAGKLFGHRVVEKKEEITCIITRPDRTKNGNDGPLYEENLLGIVRSIQRNGKHLDTARAAYSSFAKLYHSFALLLIEKKQIAWQQLIPCIASIQQTRLYRFIAHRVFAPAIKKLGFTVYLPLRIGTASPFSRKIAGADVDKISLNPDDNKPFQWRICFEIRRHIAASISFSRRPAGCPFDGWWVDGVHVRLRYRESGMEEKLIGKAEEILKNSGVSTLYLNLPRESSRLHRWFHEQGFIEKDVFLAKNRDIDQIIPEGCIILEKSL
jgi:signal peptidase I